MTADRELLAVLVALEPLDDRKWHYLDLTARTFGAEAMLDQPWSSGERVLVQVAASLWDTGKVDLGYITCALGPRHFQAVIDAMAIRGGQNIISRPQLALAGIGPTPSDRKLCREPEPSPLRAPRQGPRPPSPMNPELDLGR